MHFWDSEVLIPDHLLCQYCNNSIRDSDYSSNDHYCLTDLSVDSNDITVLLSGEQKHYFHCTDSTVILQYTTDRLNQWIFFAIKLEKWNENIYKQGRIRHFYFLFWRLILPMHTLDGKREKALFRIFLTVQLRKMGHSADNLFSKQKI
jgi:hypothetical protein